MTKNSTLNLIACGDIMLHGRYDDIANSSGPEFVFSGVKNLFCSSDLTVGNMESVLAKDGTPRDDKLCLKANPVYARALAESGMRVLSLANNHSLDYGNDGLRETRQHLLNQKLMVLGAGDNFREATEPLIFEHNGIKLGFLAYCHDSTKPSATASANTAGIASLEYSAALDAVMTLKATVDHVIMLLHWGLEYSHYPTPEQVSFAREAIEQGASVVLGHHSHCLQGIETYQGGVIAYSLANLTDASVDWQGPKKSYQAELTEVDRESFLLRLELHKDKVEIVETIPLWLDDDGRPVVAESEKARKILQQLEEYSRKLEGSELESFWEDQVIGSRVSGPLASWWNSGTLWEKVKRVRPGQLVTLYLLVKTYLRIKFTRSESKWLLFNTRNDTRPMPSSNSDKSGND